MKKITRKMIEESLLDTILKEHELNHTPPPNSFTLDEYAAKSALSRAGCNSLLYRLVTEGKLDKVKVKIPGRINPVNYYFKK